MMIRLLALFFFFGLCHCACYKTSVNLKIRSQPSSDATTLITIPAGSVVNRLNNDERSDNTGYYWWYVQSGQSRGWAAKNWFTEAPCSSGSDGSSNTGTVSIRCESKSQSYASCSIGDSRRVTQISMKKQLSSSPCTFGYSYGFRPNTPYIFADKGCRADFDVTYSATGGSGSPPPGPSPTPSPSPPSSNSYAAIPYEGQKTDRNPPQHGDLNLSLRGYINGKAFGGLTSYNGPTPDADAPRVKDMFSPKQDINWVQGYKVGNWDWGCNCRANYNQQYETTLSSFKCPSSNSELRPPSRSPQIFRDSAGRDFRALVLYAESNRLTIVYTRKDTVAIGYAVHFEDIQVDANLLNLYNQLNSQNRAALPGLTNGQPIGRCIPGRDPKIAIRDTGAFMDPWSQRDWYN